MVLMVPVNAVIAMKTKTYQVSLIYITAVVPKPFFYYYYFAAPFFFLFNLEYEYFALIIPLRIYQISFFYFKLTGKN